MRSFTWKLELVSNIPWLTVVTRQIHAHYVAGHRGCTPHCPNQKLTKYGNLYLKWCKYTVPKWKINVLKQLLFQSISHWTRIILQDNSNAQVLSLNKLMSSEQTVPDTLKPEQWSVQSQPTHCKCKGDKNRWHMCCWLQTNQYLVSKQGRKQITRKQIIGTITCSKSIVNASGSCKRNDTNGVCWWHWTDHYVVETYAITSKY